MKAVIFLMLLLPAMAGAQKYILLDRSLKGPFLFRDSITLQDVATGAFPVYAEDLSAVIDQLQAFTRMLAADEHLPASMDTLEREHSQLFFSKKNTVFTCVWQTSDKTFSVPLQVAGGGRSRAIRQLTQLLDYLRHNQAVMPQTQTGPLSYH